MSENEENKKTEKSEKYQNIKKDFPFEYVTENDVTGKIKKEVKTGYIQKNDPKNAKKEQVLKEENDNKVLEHGMAVKKSDKEQDKKAKESKESAKKTEKEEKKLVLNKQKMPKENQKGQINGFSGDDKKTSKEAEKVEEMLKNDFKEAEKAYAEEMKQEDKSEKAEKAEKVSEKNEKSVSKNLKNTESTENTEEADKNANEKSDTKDEKADGSEKTEKDEKAEETEGLATRPKKDLKPEKEKKEEKEEYQGLLVNVGVFGDIKKENGKDSENKNSRKEPGKRKILMHNMKEDDKKKEEEISKEEKYSHYYRCYGNPEGVVRFGRHTVDDMKENPDLVFLKDNKDNEKKEATVSDNKPDNKVEKAENKEAEKATEEKNKEVETAKTEEETVKAKNDKESEESETADKTEKAEAEKTEKVKKVEKTEKTEKTEENKKAESAETQKPKEPSIAGKETPSSSRGENRKKNKQSGKSGNSGKAEKTERTEKAEKTGSAAKNQKSTAVYSDKSGGVHPSGAGASVKSADDPFRGTEQRISVYGTGINSSSQKTVDAEKEKRKNRKTRRAEKKSERREEEMTPHQKRSSLRKFIILMIVLAIVGFFTGVYAFYNSELSTTDIDLAGNIRVQFEGTDGYGTGKVIDNSIRITGKHEKDDLKQIQQFTNGVSYTFSNDGKLKNGEKTTVKVNYSQTLAHKARLKVTRATKTFVVSGLAGRYSSGTEIDGGIMNLVKSGADKMIRSVTTDTVQSKSGTIKYSTEKKDTFFFRDRNSLSYTNDNVTSLYKVMCTYPHQGNIKKTFYVYVTCAGVNNEYSNKSHAVWSWGYLKNTKGKYITDRGEALIRLKKDVYKGYDASAVGNA